MNSLKNLVKNIAPIIATVLGGPLAGSAMSLLGNALLNDSSASPKDIEKALISATPEILKSIKELDNKFQVDMERIGLDKEQLIFLDRQNARQRELELKDNMPSILAIGLTLGFFGLLFTIAFYPIPESSKTVLDVMIGILGTSWLSAISYYFGSSKGSHFKNQLIYHEQNKN